MYTIKIRNQLVFVQRANVTVYMQDCIENVVNENWYRIIKQMPK